MSENFETAGNFDAIVSGVEADVPVLDFRKDGIYFYAVNDGVVTYQDVMESRVIMLVRVDTNVTMDLPNMPAGQKLANGVTVHPITICKADGTDCTTTDGFTVKLPGHDRILNGPVREYIKANTIKLLVRLYGLGV